MAGSRAVWDAHVSSVDACRCGTVDVGCGDDLANEAITYSDIHTPRQNASTVSGYRCDMIRAVWSVCGPPARVTIRASIEGDPG